MKALYRKYRPTRLEDVVGEDQVIRPLLQSLKEQKTSHAYLFIGPRGTGKTSVARILAHAINGFEYQLEDSYLDIIEIDAASNTGVDNIRELREKAIIAPSKGKYKVYIIDEVHMLSKSAANALLKTLEEPPEHVVFIMATTEANKVPITISSRTQLYNFRLAAPEVMHAHLAQIAQTEKIPIEDEALEVIVHRGGGSFRDSLSLLDQISTLSASKGETITAKMVLGALGLPEQEIINNLLIGFASQDVNLLQSTLKNALNAGLSPENLAGELISRIIEQPAPEYYPLLAALPAVSPPFPEAKLLLALIGNIKKPAAVRPESAQIAPSMPPTVATAVPPSSEPKIAPEASNSPKEAFSWGDFVAKVAKTSDGVANLLKKCQFELKGEVLHLYPNSQFVQKQLTSPRANKILADASAGRNLVVHDINEQKTEKDAALSKISAIMGNVQELDGESPF